MKKVVLLISSIIILGSKLLSQTLFSNSFGSLTLQSYTSGNVVTKYATASPEFQLINDGYPNNTGTNINPNSPFNVPALKNAGWVVAYNKSVNDTFLVSSSWLDDPNISSNEWILTPTVNVSANTIITWLAMSPDPTYPDGYEMYGTNKTGTLTSTDFTIGDRLFHMPDAQTQGGGEKNVWTRRSVYLGLFAGQNLRFAFRNHSKNMFQIWIDDIEIKTVTYTKEAVINSIETERYFLTNTTQTLGVTVSSKGATAINTLVLNYQYGTSGVNSQTYAIVDGLNYLQSGTFNFALPYSISSPGCYQLKCWISSVNGSLDQDQSTDTLKTFVTAQTSAPQKNVLLEQFVNAYNGEGPDAQQKCLELQSDRVIAVNVHDGDSLEQLSASGVINTYLQRPATAMVDRVYFTDIANNTIERTSYSNRITSRLSAVTPAVVSIKNKLYHDPTRSLSFDVKVDFTGEVKGDFRINAYLIENNVSGKASDTTINGYNQISNYFNVPWSPYYQKGYYSAPVNAWVLDGWRFKHQNVLVYSFDGSFGNTGNIPSNGGTQGQSFQKTFSLTVPSSTNGAQVFNADNIYIVGFVAEYDADKNRRNILNVTKEKMTTNGEVIGLVENNVAEKLNVFPNPTFGQISISNLNPNIRYNIKLYDVVGKCVWNKLQIGGAEIEKIDLKGLDDGLYILELVGEGTQRTEKIVIKAN